MGPAVASGSASVTEVATTTESGAAGTEAASADVSASAVTGSRGAPLSNPEYQPAQNVATDIGGRTYTGHALDQMRNRGLVPSVIDDTIEYGTESAGQDGATVYTTDQARVIVNPDGRVVTAMPQ